MDETDTPLGGEAMSLDDAAKAYAATRTTEPQGQPDTDETDEADVDDLETGELDETENDGQADEEAIDEPGSDLGRYVAKNGKVKLEDGSTVTVDELIKGNLRDRDYRQKTMALSDDRKVHDGQSAALRASEQQLQQHTALVSQVLQAVIGAEPDPSLLQTDPMGYLQQKENREGWGRYLTALAQQNDYMAQQHRFRQDQEMQGVIAREGEALIAKVPAFRDQQKLDAFHADIAKFAPSYGFTSDDVKNAVRVNHRLAVVLQKAMSWDKLQANKANVVAKVENRPPVIKGGKRLGAGEHQARAVSDARARAQKSGRIEDVAAAYHASRKTG